MYCLIPRQFLGDLTTPSSLRHLVHGKSDSGSMVLMAARFPRKCALHFGRLTWNTTMEVCKIMDISLLNGWFVGSILIFQGVHKSHWIMEPQCFWVKKWTSKCETTIKISTHTWKPFTTRFQWIFGETQPTQLPLPPPSPEQDPDRAFRWRSKMTSVVDLQCRDEIAFFWPNYGISPTLISLK